MENTKNSKKISLCFFLLVCSFYSCSNTDDKLLTYIEKHCDLSKSNNCHINIKDALKVDFDTMYVFGGYTEAEEISAFLRLNYSNTNLIKDGYSRIILVKNRKIVYENDFEQKHAKISRGKNIKIVIDGKVTCSAKIYLSPIFKVEKISDEKGQLIKKFYVLKNVQFDGIILPRDTVGVGDY